ncbi:MAG: transposase [Bacteroidota bacterium]
MSERYQNKYRIASARAQWWNYGWNGAYFVTICTQNREHFFGEINDGKMCLSRTGVIADILWHQIPHHAPFVELGDFVVMPNHVHGIVILNKPNDGIQNNDNNNNRGDDTGTGMVETLQATSLPPPQPPSPSRQSPQSQPPPPPKNQRMAAISPRTQTLSTVVRSYKSAVTRHANRLGLEHGWQARFHDRIIRHDAEYQRISDYIVANPENWQDDQFYATL